MTTYWISQPKYYCKFCKCWMVDKKLTREAHEKGSRHKQAVREHFDGLKKAKIEKEKEDQEVLSEIERIQKAAGQQYAEDVSKGYASQIEAPTHKQPQYFYYGSPDEAFISAQSEEKARLTAYYQQIGYLNPDAAASTEIQQEGDGTEGDLELQALIELRKEQKRKREEEESKQKGEETKEESAPRAAAGPYGAWVVVEKAEIEKREDGQRALKRQRAREAEQDSSDSDASEEDDRPVVANKEEEPVEPVEFKKRPHAGRKRPPLCKKLADDEAD